MNGFNIWFNRHIWWRENSAHTFFSEKWKMLSELGMSDKDIEHCLDEIIDFMEGEFGH